MPQIRQFAVEMALGGRNGDIWKSSVVPALQAWKAAQNTAFHIPTATAAAWSQLPKCKTQPKQSTLTDSCAEPILVCLWPDRVPAELSFDSHSVIVGIQGGLDVDSQINLRDGCRQRMFLVAAGERMDHALTCVCQMGEPNAAVR